MVGDADLDRIDTARQPRDIPTSDVANGMHHTPTTSLAPQQAGSSQDLQAVDLSNLFAGIWMDDNDDANISEPGESRACNASGSALLKAPHGSPLWAVHMRSLPRAAETFATRLLTCSCR